MWWSPLITVCFYSVYLNSYLHLPILPISSSAKSECPGSSCQLAFSLKSLAGDGGGGGGMRRLMRVCMSRYIQFQKLFLLGEILRTSNQPSLTYHRSNVLQLNRWVASEGDWLRSEALESPFLNTFVHVPDCGELKQGPAGQPCLFKLLTNLWVLCAELVHEVLELLLSWTCGKDKMK